MSDLRPGEGDERGGDLSKEAAADVRTVAKGGAVQVVGQISQRSLSFFFGIAFTRILDEVSFGLYRIVSQSLANLAQLGLLGLNYATMRFIARARARGEPGKVKGALRVGIGGVLGISLLVMVVVLIAPGPIASIFDDDPARRDELVDLFRWGAPYIPLFALLQVLRYGSQAYKTMVPSVVAGNIVQPVTRFVFGVTALALGFEITGAVISLNLSLIAALLLIAYYLRRLLTDEERKATPVRETGPMFRFAIPQSGASLLGIQTLGLGILLLGALDTNRQAGLFAIALALQGPGNVFLGGIVNIWAPVVADLYERGAIDRLGALYQTINRWIATFSFPVFAALIIMPELFVWFYGPSAEGAESVVVFLAIGNIFYTGTGPTGYVISMTGRPGVNFINSAVSAALYIGLGIWIIPEHGAVGMAAIDAVVTALVNSARVIEAKILVGVQPFGRTFWKPVAATLIGAAVLLLWRFIDVSGLWFGWVGVTVAGAVYLGALRFFGLDEEELEVIRRIRARALRR